MNKFHFIAQILLVGVLINSGCCRKNGQIYRLADDNLIRGISDGKNDIEGEQKNIPNTSRGISLPRTIMPSYPVILLEVTFMAISIYLVNSLENYIQQKSKSVTKPKHGHIEDNFLENFKNVLQNL